MYHVLKPCSQTFAAFLVLAQNFLPCLAFLDVVGKAPSPCWDPRMGHSCLTFLVPIWKPVCVAAPPSCPERWLGLLGGTPGTNPRTKPKADSWYLAALLAWGRGLF